MFRKSLLTTVIAGLFFAPLVQAAVSADEAAKLKTTLTPLVGFLAKERTSLSNGNQTFYGAAVDIAERKTDVGKVANAMELRPTLWRRTEDRVFLRDYKPATLPGALLRAYVVETEPLEGWRTFKTGNEPTFEEWKRLTGR